jgi:hypothetical protein
MEELRKKYPRFRPVWQGLSRHHRIGDPARPSQARDPSGSVGPVG